MSEHDELVEKVKGVILSSYLDMDASDLGKRMNAGMSAREAVKQLLNGIIPEVISAYRHAAMPTAGDGWRTIDSAPRDAQLILGHSEQRWIRFGRYYPEFRKWYYSGTNERQQYSETEGGVPTHWRPLPPPPGEKP